MIIYTCPECGHDLIDYSLTSDPPISKKECLNCGWNKIIESKEIIRIPFGGNSSNMRNATPEEKEHIQKYIEQHSIPTGVNFWDMQEKLNKHEQEIHNLLEKETKTLW